MAGRRVTVTVSETVHVERSPGAVFDYTQDYAARPNWDPAVTAAEVLSEERDGGTDWTQIISLELKAGLAGRLLAPSVRRNLVANTRKSMATARAIMESRRGKDSRSTARGA